MIEPSDGVTWQLTSVLIRTIDILDPADVNPERSMRVSVSTELELCDATAMPSVVWDANTREVFVDARAWRPLNVDCDSGIQEVTNPVLLRFPSAGTWTVRPGVPGRSEDGIVVEVQAAPARACTPQAFNCLKDCDCQAGEACLGASGFAGPFTQCVRPCELDRDCGGTGRCLRVNDGLSYYCDESVPECGDGVVCPDGFNCKDGACEAAFTLNQDTRISCGSDSGCPDGLHCVEPGPGQGERRCEALCKSAGAGWCTGAHVCGAAGEDLAGLAVSDSVCVWLGE